MFSNPVSLLNDNAANSTNITLKNILRRICCFDFILQYISLKRKFLYTYKTDEQLAELKLGLNDI